MFAALDHSYRYDHMNQLNKVSFQQSDSIKIYLCLSVSPPDSNQANHELDQYVSVQSYCMDDVIQTNCVRDPNDL